MRLFLSLLVVAGCVDASDEPTAPNQLDGKSDDGGPLWAGLTSITLERWTPDLCNNGANALGENPVSYDSWARQRAGIRNICFEVWKPGVTDRDYADYWKDLDVQVHYRYGGSGAYHMAYVPSIDRRGNNRRFAFALDTSLDPFASIEAPSIPALAKKAPIQIVREGDGYVSLAVDLELYFTVNGRVLKPSAQKNFTIHYLGDVYLPKLAPNPTGLVITTNVTCESGAAKFGSGAGYFVADIRKSSAITTLAAGLDGSWYYPGPVGMTASVLSLSPSEQKQVTGQMLPSWTSSGGMRFMPDGTQMRVELDVYDKAAAATKTVSATFTGCTL